METKKITFVSTIGSNRTLSPFGFLQAHVNSRCSTDTFFAPSTRRVLLRALGKAGLPDGKFSNQKSQFG
jgi:hypothetical protein